jgi:hypothetical protein
MTALTSIQVLRQIALLSCIALLPTSFVLMWLSQSLNAKGYLQSETNNEMKFRRPRMHRASLVALSLWFPCALVLPFLLQDSSSTRGPGTHQSVFLPVAAFGLLMLLFLSQTGPSDLDLDGARRIYRWRWGAPWRLRIRTGTWDDLSGIYVKKLSKSRDGYIVGLRWNGTWRACALGTFHGRANANSFATSTANKLHLPLVEPPPQPQLRDVFKA